MMTKKVRRFDIWIADLDTGFGSEPGKVRPVVVVQSDLINELNHSSFLICPISSQERNTKGKLRIFTKATLLNGLDKDSYILVDQIRSVDINRIKEKLGFVDESTSEKLMETIKILLDI